MTRFVAAAVLTASLLVLAAAAAVEWDPQAISKQETLEFLTVGPEEGEHWSTVWLVVIDGQVYIRLGSRAAGRMEKNTTAPFVKVRIAGQVYDHVKAEAAPNMVEPVAKAMGEKYTSDFLVKYFNHPLTMRLTPSS
jgi:hypothetical protein